DLGRVPHLRHPLGTDEAGDFDFAQAGILQALDQFDLVRGGNGLGFVLQAITRADIDQGDVGGQMVGRAGVHVVHAMRSSSLPSASWSPTAHRTSVTVPALGAVRVCSIFMASVTARGSPWATCWPGCTSSAMTLPGIRAVSLPPWAGAWSTLRSGSTHCTCAWPCGVKMS